MVVGRREATVAGPVDGMHEVIIDSIRVGLRNLRRVVILREKDSERYLVIWIGPDLADAITLRLQDVSVARPLTHDLMLNMILELGGDVKAVVINDLRRAWVPYAFARVVFPLVFRSRVSVDDGLLSIRRGFTRHELETAFRDSGIGSVQIESRFPYRLVAIAKGLT